MPALSPRTQAGGQKDSFIEGLGGVNIGSCRITSHICFYSWQSSPESGCVACGVTPSQASEKLPTEQKGLYLTVFITERVVNDAESFRASPPTVSLVCICVFEPWIEPHHWTASLTRVHSSTPTSSSWKISFLCPVYCCPGNKSFFMLCVWESVCWCVFEPEKCSPESKLVCTFSSSVNNWIGR